MKILFSGYHNPHYITITEYFEKAIKTLGHELFIFNDRQHIIPGRIRKHIQWLNKIDLLNINKNIISLALRKRPDIIIVTGGHRITGSIVKKLKENGIITVLWTIDPPRNFQPLIDVAPLYDHIFCQGNEAVELLDKAGISGAQLLPVGCDPDHHYPVESTPEEKKQYQTDIAFVGSWYPNRMEILESISDYDLGVWGPGWQKTPESSPLKKRVKRAGDVLPEEWRKIYSLCKINIVIHYQDDKITCYQASPKVFEVLACRGFLLGDDQKDVTVLFERGKHLETFKTIQELKEKIQYYLSHPEERKIIAEAGYKEVLKNHTYVHRIEELIGKVKENT